MDALAPPRGLAHADDAMEIDDHPFPSTQYIDAKPRLSYSRGLPSQPYPGQPPRWRPGPPCGDANSALIDRDMKAIEKNFDYLNISRNSFETAAKALSATKTDGWNKWKYDMRDGAQPVLPYMVIAPTNILKDLNFMTKNKFSLVVILRDKSMAHFPWTTTDAACANLPGVDVLKAVVEHNSRFAQFELLEYNERRNKKSANWNSESWNARNGLQKIISILVNHRISAEEERVKQQINAEGDNEPTERFLITCASGNHWSPIVVAAYIMAVFDMSSVDAGKFILQYRLSCNDLDISSKLEAWEQLLKAAGDVTASGTSIEDQQNRQKFKRAPDSDLDQFHGREALAPFI
ncbi:dual specificity protein phosphatase 3 [Cordyceps fumosorosea ARSEF 2679]|uniref:Dual specificity protein phosphatase 3 n=1 Tax=Cordyceps fumosorosea (strain ARSEF 2679) TaxID=1081104 RepID=A0A167R4P3_CORFA|nr:dual specificity protein phosphatase 3 [Cordyceps fumosorosea ARSEF 2679]OAA58268.1 dual specificity protein phosphatase 3 [Cordyceps fumosorosea ARSEF 2679]